MLAMPSAYKNQVKQFIAWLNASENKSKSSQDKINQFFALLGFVRGQAYTALQVQHVVGLALRELLAQVREIEPSAVYSSPDELRATFASADPTNPGVNYNSLNPGELEQLNRIFGIRVPVVKSLKLQADREYFTEEFNNAVGSDVASRTPGQRANGVLKLVNAYCDAYAGEVGEAAANAIFLVPGHFTVRESHVLGYGLCGTAAFAMKMAAVNANAVAPITDHQSVHYHQHHESAVTNTGNVVENGLGQAPEQRLDALVNKLKAEVDAKAFPDAEHLKVRIDLEYAKRNLDFLIANCDRVAVHHDAQQVRAAKEVKAEVAAVGGMDQFIAQQEKLLKKFAAKKARASTVSHPVRDTAAFYAQSTHASVRSSVASVPVAGK